MKGQLHINDNGDIKNCSAKTLESCRFKAHPHFKSSEEAQTYFEKDSESKMLKTVRKKNPSEKLLSEIDENVAEVIKLYFDKNMKDLRAFEKEFGAVEKATREDFNVSDYMEEVPYALRDRGSDLVTFEELKNGYQDTYFEDDGNAIFVLSARQGGGNRDCFCTKSDDSHEEYCLALNNEMLVDNPQYITDEDDMGDSTYAYFYFRTNLPADKLKESEDFSEKITNLWSVKKELASVKKGELAPWHINNKDFSSKVWAHANMKNKSLDIKKDLEAFESANEKVNTVLKSLEEGALTQEELYSINSSDRYSAPLQTFSRYKKYEEELRIAEQMVSDAEQLPEGPLKDKLLKDRGTASYKTKVKQGRRNVEVTKTYDRGSELGFEVKNNRKYLVDAKRDLTKSLQESILSENIRKKYGSLNVKEKIEKSYSDSLENIEKARKEAWFSGIENSVKKPKVPENFLKN